MYRTKGFTLVEILIVVIILGILAAIVIPQFTEASNDARESALASDLQTIRSQVELYKVQHNMYPGYTYDPDTDTTSAWDGATFVTQLTGTTDGNGNAGTDYGPYLQKFPANGFVSGANADAVTGDGTDGYGWNFNATTGKFTANDAAHSSL